MRTGEQKLVLMTSALDVLSETPLHADEFGEGLMRSCFRLYFRNNSRHYQMRLSTLVGDRNKPNFMVLLEKRQPRPRQ